MDEVHVIIFFIIVMTICIIFTILKLLHFIGIFSTPKISAGKPHFGSMYIAYKYHNENTSNSSIHFADIAALCGSTHLDTIGVFYDNPRMHKVADCRFVIGAILSTSEEKADDDILKKFKSNNYNFITFPSISYAITSSFPFIATASAGIGARKIYPAINEYIDIHKLSAHPFIEVYTKTMIRYIVPLSMQTDFYIPEIKSENTN